MKDKIKEFKQCLKSFGYRPLNDNILAKPIAFLIIFAEIMEDKAVFTIQFHAYHDGSTAVWNKKEILFENEEYNIFKDPETLSKRIATTELILFSSHTPFYTGLSYSPWNFNTPIDLYEI
jgi:hypothetical protein